MKKRYKYTLIIMLALSLVLVSFITGCLVGFGTKTPSEKPDYDLINQAWNSVYQYYVESDKLDATKISQGAVQGIVDSLNDPYSAYMDPDTTELFMTKISGNFEGIGATVNMNPDDWPIIVTPIESSPAEAAGLKAGDIILAVDGESVYGLNLTEVVLKIRGPSGTQVTITIQREGETDPIDITVTRAVINVPSVDWEMKDDIAYISIIEFREGTNEELDTVLAAIDMNTTKGIILDLRNNPGGIVTTVIDVASHFIDKGVIVTMIDNKGNQTSDSVNPNGVFIELPIVVLVNEYSASGSEILAGALQDYKRAAIAGVTTYGKGSYNITIPLDDGSSIYLTIGRWATPNGNLIEGEGIVPDYVLAQTGDEEVQWAIDFLHGEIK